MLFNDKFIEFLKDDPLTGAIEICKIASERVKKYRTDDGELFWNQEAFEELSECYALIAEMLAANILRIKFEIPYIVGDIKNACYLMYSFLDEVFIKCTAEANEFRIQSLRSRYSVSLGNKFSYEFSQGDLDRIQHLLNQLRELIANSSQLEEEHQQRLLRRLEKLQSEIHKKVSDLDRFWGLIGDAGVVVGKLGSDAKPIVDRIREIAEIVWQTQSRAEELPSGTQLPSLANKPVARDEKI